MVNSEADDIFFAVGRGEKLHWCFCCLLILLCGLLLLRGLLVILPVETYSSDWFCVVLDLLRALNAYDLPINALRDTMITYWVKPEAARFYGAPLSSCVFG